MSFEIKLKKTIGQIKFRPTMDAFEKVPEVAKILENDFEEWQAEKHSNILLYSKDKELFQVTSNALTYINEKNLNYANQNESPYKELVDYLKATFEKNVHEHSVVTVRSVGCRSTLLLETGFEFSELVELVFEKFYSNSGDIKALSGDCTDTLFLLHAKNGKINNRVKIGPVGPEEGIANFDSSFKESAAKFTKNGIYLDVDCHINEDLDTTNTVACLESLTKANATLVTGYIKLLFGV